MTQPASYWPKDYAAPVAANKMIWDSFARLLEAYLIEQTVGVLYEPAVLANWSIATNAEPEKPVSCIALFDEASQERNNFLNSGKQDDPSVSIRVRSIVYEQGMMKAKQIMQVIDKLSSWSWTEPDSNAMEQTVIINSAHRARGIFNLGKDEKNRWVFNLEYSFAIKSIT